MKFAILLLLVPLARALPLGQCAAAGKQCAGAGQEAPPGGNVTCCDAGFNCVVVHDLPQKMFAQCVNASETCALTGEPCSPKANVGCCGALDKVAT